MSHCHATLQVPYHTIPYRNIYVTGGAGVHYRVNFCESDQVEWVMSSGARPPGERKESSRSPRQ